MKAESFLIDRKKGIGIMALGPHPSKSPLGPARAARRDADGSFARLDLDNDGKSDIARFLLDVNVVQPGRYDASIRIGKSPNQPLVDAEQVLAAGKQTMTLESDRAFLSMLENDPKALLSPHFTTPNRVPEGEFPGVVAIDSAIPKAGASTILNPLRGDTRAAGVRWRLATFRRKNT